MEKKEDKKRRQIFLDKPAVFGVYLTSISDAGENPAGKREMQRNI